MHLNSADYTREVAIKFVDCMTNILFFIKYNAYSENFRVGEQMHNASSNYIKHYMGLSVVADESSLIQFLCRTIAAFLEVEQLTSSRKDTSNMRHYYLICLTTRNT